jgi:Mn2+/Fe2+ NRAMP family transporter
VFAAVVGPGVLAGLSDDDPAGITTYSILGAKYGYRLLWVLALSTAALIVFHELGADGDDLLTGLSRYVSVPVAAVAIGALVVRGSFRRVEHVLLALSAVFVTYFVSGFLARPDWPATARGAFIPTMPLTRDAALVAVATVGTTLAPWGLAFIQSYTADKRLPINELRYERIDVAVGAVMTGVIGLFIVLRAPPRCTRAGLRSRTHVMPRRPCDRWPDRPPRNFSASDSWAQRSWLPRSCRSQPRTRRPKRSSARPTSMTRSEKRQCSTRRTAW